MPGKIVIIRWVGPQDLAHGIRHVVELYKYPPPGGHIHYDEKEKCIRVQEKVQGHNGIDRG